MNLVNILADFSGLLTTSNIFPLVSIILLFTASQLLFWSTKCELCNICECHNGGQHFSVSFADFTIHFVIITSCIVIELTAGSNIRNQHSRHSQISS